MADVDPFAGLPADFIPSADARKALDDLGKFARTYSGIFALAKIGANAEALAQGVREKIAERDSLAKAVEAEKTKLAETQVKRAQVEEDVLASVREADQNRVKAREKALEVLKTAEAKAAALAEATSRDATETVAKARGDIDRLVAEADAKAKEAEDKVKKAETDLAALNKAKQAAQTALDRVNAELEATYDRLKPR